MSTNPCPNTDLHRPYPRTLTITYTLTPVNVDALRYFFNRQTVTPALLDLLGDTDRPSPLEDWAPRQPTRWEPIPMTLAHRVCERGR